MLMKVSTLSRLFFVCILCYACKSQPTSNNQAPSNSRVGGAFENPEFTYIKIPKVFSTIDTSPAWKLNINRLHITGTIYQSDGKTPAQGVLLYYYQTNAEGRYIHQPQEPRSMPPNEKGQTHGFIRGWVVSDANGKYEIYTIRPGVYPTRDAPAHIHATIKEQDINEYYIDDFVFDDDSLVTAAYISKQEFRCGSGILHLEKEDSIWEGKRNLVLGKNIPNYPTTKH